MLFKARLHDLIFATLIFLLFNSCDFISEPERVINENVNPPQAGTLQFQELSKGQHIDGTIYFEVNTDSIDFEVTELQLYVDDEYATFDYSKPYILELNTRDYSEGLHQLSVAIYNKDRNHGMLNLLYPPSLILNNELFFDRTPPQAVVLNINKSDDGKVALLNWTESTNLNFVAYRIYRSYKNNYWDIIDTIYQKSQITFIDSTIVEIYGLEVKYMVEVTTHSSFYDEYTELSNTDTMVYGKILYYPNFGWGLRDVVLNTQVPEIYFVGSQTLTAFSTENQSLLRETLVPIGPSGSLYGHFTISLDNSKLFIFDFQNRIITIINAENFSVLKTFTLNIDPFDATGKTSIYHLGGSRIIIITPDTIIRIIDTDTEEVIDSSSSSIHLGFRSSAITDDRSFLIISQRNVSGTECKIVVRDLSTPGLQIINEKITDYYYTKLKISPGGQKLYGIAWAGGGIDIRDIASLDINSSISTTYGFETFTIDGQNIYAYRYKLILPDLVLGGEEIIAYDINSLEQRKSWLAVLDGSADIAVSSDYIYSRSSATDAVAIAIPL